MEKLNTQDKIKVIAPVPQNAPKMNYKLKGKEPDNVYAYHNDQGELMGYVARFNEENGRKKIMPISYCEKENGKCCWMAQGIPDPFPLYKLPPILAEKEKKVMICEGEKTADAAQILFPDYVTTTTMFGAQSPHKSDLSFLAGRDVIIATDYDEPGEKYGKTLHTLCQKVGVASIVFLNLDLFQKFSIKDNELVSRDEQLKKGYDLADAVEEGWTSTFLTSAEQKGVSLFTCPNDSETPEIDYLDVDGNLRFCIKDGGVYYYNERKGDWNWLCSYLRVVAETHDSKQENYGIKLELINGEGAYKTVNIPRSMLAGDGRGYREMLLSLGMRLEPSKSNMLTRYIAMSKPKDRITIASSIGWHEHMYILPHKTYGVPNSRVELCYEIKHPYQQRGTLQDWQSEIGQYAAGNPNISFAIALAFTGPLLFLLGEENFGVHFFGDSSIGKTTLLHLVRSVWGGEINSWRTTDNAAESLAKQANDGLLLLDELGQVNSYNLDAMAYMFGNGSGKARALKTGDVRPKVTFRTVFLSSGENNLEGKLNEIQKHVKGGQAVRFIEIPADSGANMGIFENLHGFKTAAGLADHLKKASNECSGTAIDMFLKLLVTNRKEAADFVGNYMKRWVESNIPKNWDGQAQRVGRKFALVAAVGEYVIEHGILPIKASEVCKACVCLFSRWIKARGGHEPLEITQARKNLLKLLQQSESGRFEVVEASSQPVVKSLNNRAGFKVCDEASNVHYCIFQSVYKDEVCGGRSSPTINRHFIDKGILLPDASGKASQSKSIKGREQARYYVVPECSIPLLEDADT